MKLVVANLTEEDMVAIAAYVASRPPASASPSPASTSSAVAPTQGEVARR